MVKPGLSTQTTPQFEHAASWFLKKKLDECNASVSSIGTQVQPVPDFKNH